MSNINFKSSINKDYFHVEEKRDSFNSIKSIDTTHSTTSSTTSSPKLHTPRRRRSSIKELMEVFRPRKSSVQLIQRRKRPVQKIKKTFSGKDVKDRNKTKYKWENDYEEGKNHSLNIYSF